MKKYRIGIIGFGGFGQFLYHWWKDMEQVEVVAVADPLLSGDIDRRLRTYHDWKELIAEQDIDIVSIATPPFSHAEIACAAMLAGKHVLLEKPLAIDEAGITAVLDTARSAGRIFVVDHMLRYNPLIRSMAEWSRDRSFGPLRHAEVSNYAQDQTLPEEHWFWDESRSGGILVEHAVHFFDIINSLSQGQWQEVSGISHRRNTHQRDQVAAQVRYSDGLIAHHYHAFSGPGFFEKTTIRLVFDLARVEIGGWIPLDGSVEVLVNEETETLLTALPGWRTREKIPVGSIGDVSRPEGWGYESAADANQVVFKGNKYSVTHLIRGSFGLSESKSAVYGQCLRAIMADLLLKIENPAHKMTVTAEDAAESVKMALLARK